MSVEHKIKHSNQPVNGITLGEEVTDSVTGFKGIAISRTTFMNRCVQIGVRKRTGENEKPGEVVYIDEKGAVEYEADGKDRDFFAFLGHKGTDKITQYTGTIHAVSEYIFSEMRIAIQAHAIVKGVPAEDRLFDRNQVLIEELQKPPVQPPAPRVRTGGPGDRAPHHEMAPR